MLYEQIYASSHIIEKCVFVLTRQCWAILRFIEDYPDKTCTVLPLSWIDLPKKVVYMPRGIDHMSLMPFIKSCSPLRSIPCTGFDQLPCSLVKLGGMHIL